MTRKLPLWINSILFSNAAVAFHFGFSGDSSSHLSKMRQNVPTSRPPLTKLSLFRRVFRGGRGNDEQFDSEWNFYSSTDTRTMMVSSSNSDQQEVCVIGAGVSGLVAATELAKNYKVVLLEANSHVGGRVRSDYTDDGFILDRGFAVFVEQYPFSKQLLDYGELKLGKFLPGALVKLEGQEELAQVSNPLVQPKNTLQTIRAPIGTIGDKLALLPLVLHCVSSSAEQLFEEAETSTLSALKDKWKLSDTILENFLKPFLEGIYLVPLDQQSSRMFEFVFKMFAQGVVSLPTGGMGQISKQLAEKAITAGVDIRTDWPVEEISVVDGGFSVTRHGLDEMFLSKRVVCATEAPVARALLSKIDGLGDLVEVDQSQRQVGCLYYVFEGLPPVSDPILILNGIGKKRGTLEHPINNVCFPSVVSEGYAPEGSHICSVTILESTMKLFHGLDDDLDDKVRRELSTWFPEHRHDILHKWELKRIYRIENAQPGQFGVPFPANQLDGRGNNQFWGKQLPPGLFVCGDHTATATLNGALGSGLAAAEAVTLSLKS